MADGQQRIPILRMGKCLLVTIQVDLQDQIALALQDDLSMMIDKIAVVFTLNLRSGKKPWRSEPPSRCAPSGTARPSANDAMSV